MFAALFSGKILKVQAGVFFSSQFFFPVTRKNTDLKENNFEKGLCEDIISEFITICVTQKNKCC